MPAAIASSAPMTSHVRFSRAGCGGAIDGARLTRTGGGGTPSRVEPLGTAAARSAGDEIAAGIAGEEIAPGMADEDVAAGIPDEDVAARIAGDESAGAPRGPTTVCSRPRAALVLSSALCTAAGRIRSACTFIILVTRFWATACMAAIGKWPRRDRCCTRGNWVSLTLGRPRG